jgi:hypothetical protein
MSRSPGSALSQPPTHAREAQLKYKICPLAIILKLAHSRELIAEISKDADN